MKTCQFCCQEIVEAAIVCHYCQQVQIIENQREKYVGYIVNEKISGGSSLLGRIYWSSYYIGAFFIAITAYENSITLGIIVSVIALAIIYGLETFFKRKITKLSLVELATEYRDYKEKQSTRRWSAGLLLGIILLLLMFASYSDYDTQEFRNYYLYHNPDAQILAIYRENHIFNSEFRVKLRNGEEEIYTTRFGGVYKK